MYRFFVLLLDPRGLSVDLLGPVYSIYEGFFVYARSQNLADVSNFFMPLKPPRSGKLDRKYPVNYGLSFMYEV